MDSTKRQAWIDFRGFGHDGYLPISVFEMQLLLHGAEKMLEDYDPEAADIAMDRMRHELWWDANNEKITRRWITKAAMLIALEGLQGEKIPNIFFTDT